MIFFNPGLCACLCVCFHYVSVFRANIGLLSLRSQKQGALCVYAMMLFLLVRLSLCLRLKHVHKTWFSQKQRFRATVSIGDQ